MARYLKLLLGGAFLIGGGALLFKSARSAGLAAIASTQGLPLLSLIGAALGLACMGASLDFFGLMQRANPPPKIRNTKVYGDAEPASEVEAKAAARGEAQAPLRDRTFAE